MMKFVVTSDTDFEVSKNVKEDSILIKHTYSSKGEILLTVICDDIEVIQCFSEWFDKEFKNELKIVDLKDIGSKWNFMIKDFKDKMLECKKSFTSILFIANQYITAQIGDMRLYSITDEVQQLSDDNTTEAIPKINYGRTSEGVYMISTKGFSHELSKREIYKTFAPYRLTNEDVMHKRTRELIEMVKFRGEKDEISVILIKADCS